MIRKSNKRKSARPRLRRLFKAALWMAGIFLVLVIAAVVFVRIQYPEPRMLELISERVESGTGMSLEIRDISWRLPLRLSASQITLRYPDSRLETDKPLFALDRFSVSFRLLPLLRRRIHVQSVVLKKPSLYLDPNRLARPDSVFRKKTLSDAGPDTSKTSGAALPVALGLSRLSLHDFECILILSDAQSPRSFRISGLNVDLSGLHVPRNAAVSLMDVRGNIRLYTDQSRLHYSEEGFEIDARPDIDLRAAWRKRQQWRLRGGAGLTAASDTSQRIHIDMDVRGIGGGDSVRMETIGLALGGRPALRMRGSASRLTANPEFQATLESQSVDLSRIHFLAREFLPSAVSAMLDSMGIQGSLTLPRGRVSGRADSINMQIHASLENGAAAVSDMSLDGFHGRLDLAGCLKTGGDEKAFPRFTDGQIRGSAGMAAVHLMRADSNGVHAGPMNLRFSSRMDSLGWPEEGRLIGRLDSLFGGSAGIDFHWGRKPGAAASVSVSGSVHADSLDLAQLPLENIPMRGRVNLRAGLVMPHFQRGVLTVEAELPGLDMDFEEKEIQWPAMRFGSEWALRTDPGYRQVRLDSGRIRLNDCIHTRLAGIGNLQNGDFRIELKQADLDLNRLRSDLPARLLASEKIPLFGGRVLLSGHAEGKPDSTRLQGKILVRNGRFSPHDQNLKASGMQGEALVTGTFRQVHAALSMVLDTLDLGDRRSRPIENSALLMDARWIAEESVSLKRVLFRNDSLGIVARLSGGLSGMKTDQTLCASGDIRFDKTDWVETIQKMEIRGSTRITFQVDQTSSPPLLKIAGSAAPKQLDLKQGELLSLTGFRGRMPFQIEFDPANGVIITDPNYTPPSWIDYEDRRSQYQSLNTEQGALYAENLRVSRYRFTDLAMDIDIQKGYVQIPWFMVDLFNGNLGGYVQIFLGTGQPETIAYEIHAQAARINAEALGNFPIKNEEEAELDATMAFSGLGVDIEKEMDMDGYFYMTQIGPQFASRLLQGLDPNGEDRNIRLTRRLLNMGWKPKLFSFEMRHGYVYPSLSLSQPWFSPIRLPETLSYGRLPLKFFLENPDFVRVR